MRIGIDIDNVITNSNEYLIEKAREYNKDNNINVIEKQEPDSIKDMFSWTEEIYRNFNKKYVKSMNTYVKVKEGVIETLKKLKSNGNEIILITRRSEQHYIGCVNITKKWINENKIIYDKLITDVFDKGQKCLEEKIDIMIDDEIFNCDSVNKKGIEVLLYDSIFNKKNNDYQRIYDWNQLYQVLNFYEIILKKYGTLNIKYTDIYVISDFDNTITTAESHGSLNVITRSHLLGEDYNKEYINIVNKYENKAKSTQKNSSIVKILWKKHISKYLKILKKYDLNRELLDHIIKDSNITFRSGFRDFIEFLHKKEIPLIILSSGLGNSIEIFLKDNECYYDNIYIVSNFIEFNETGNITKVPKKVITPVNKNNVKFDKELKDMLKERNYKIIFGDIKEDSGMAQINNQDKSLSIAFLNELKLRRDLEIFFDLVTENENIFELIEKIL